MLECEPRVISGVRRRMLRADGAGSFRPSGSVEKWKNEANSEAKVTAAQAGLMKGPAVSSRGREPRLAGTTIQLARIGRERRHSRDMRMA